MAEKLLISDEEKFRKMTEEWIALAQKGDFEGIYATRRGSQNSDGTYNSAYESRFRFDCSRGENYAKTNPEVYNPLVNIFADNVQRIYFGHATEAEKYIKAGINVAKTDNSLKGFEAIWAFMCCTPGTYMPDRANNYVNALENATILIWLCGQGHISKKRLVLELNKAMMINTDFNWHIERNGKNIFKAWRINEKGL